MGIWSYGVIKLWVFDLDIFLVNRLAPGLMWIIHYKFLLIVAAIAAAALMTKKATVIGWLLYIFFYPLIVLGRVIYLVFKQKSWSLALACINSVVSFFRSLKYNLLVGAGFVLCWGGSIVLGNKPILAAIVLGLLLLLLTVSVRAFSLVFRSSSIFQVYQRLTRKIPGFVTKSLSGKANPKSMLPVMSQSELQTYRGHLQTIMLWNRGLLFVARKLESYLNSGFNAAAYAGNVVLLMGVVVLSFGCMSHALFKVDPTTFTSTAEPTFFLFQYHSLRTFLSGSIPELTPATVLSRILVMVELGFASFTIILLVVLVFSVKREKQNRQLEDTIRGLKEASANVASLLKNEYKMTTEEALREVQQMTGNAMNIISWLSQHIGTGD